MNGPQNGDEKVTKDVDCQVFEDQLDALMEGALPEAGARQLRRHAEGCPDCAMQLRMQEHLALPSLEELEGKVPEAMVGSMWAEVSAELENRQEAMAPRAEPATSGGGHFSRRKWRAPWLVPTLAAASLVLLMSTGFLYRELGRMQDRETILAQQVLEQRAWLAELGSGVTSDPVVRTAALAGRIPITRALSRQETVSFAGLRSMLGALPADRVLLDAAEARAALENSSNSALPLWREVLERLDVRDGIRAGDLLRVLEGLDVNPETRVPTSALIDLLS